MPLPRSSLQSAINIHVPTSIGALSSTMGHWLVRRESADGTLCKSWIWPHSIRKTYILHQRALKCRTYKFLFRLRGPPNVIQLRCCQMHSWKKLKPYATFSVDNVPKTSQSHDIFERPVRISATFLSSEIFNCVGQGCPQKYCWTVPNFITIFLDILSSTFHNVHCYRSLGCFSWLSDK